MQFLRCKTAPGNASRLRSASRAPNPTRNPNPRSAIPLPTIPAGWPIPLQLGWNPLSHWDGDPLASLHALSSITCLELSYCGLERLPPEMSSLRGLSDLDLSGTGPLDAAGALAPLEGLPALTRLDVRHCKLGSDLPQLQALQAAGVLVVNDGPQATV